MKQGIWTLHEKPTTSNELTRDSVQKGIKRRPELPRPKYHTIRRSTHMLDGLLRFVPLFLLRVLCAALIIGCV